MSSITDILKYHLPDNTQVPTALFSFLLVSAWQTSCLIHYIIQWDRYGKRKRQSRWISLMGCLPQKSPISLQFITHVTEEMVPCRHLTFTTILTLGCQMRLTHSLEEWFIVNMFMRFWRDEVNRCLVVYPFITIII